MIARLATLSLLGLLVLPLAVADAGQQGKRARGSSGPAEKSRKVRKAGGEKQKVARHARLGARPRVFKRALTANDATMVAIASEAGFATDPIVDSFLRGKFVFGDTGPGYQGSRAQAAVQRLLHRGEVLNGIYQLDEIGAPGAKRPAGFIVETTTAVERYRGDGRMRERVSGRRTFLDGDGKRVVERAFTTDYPMD